ncbi:hypothetical protein PshuTeo2_35340 [Pseudomonas hunanensis]|nr:hypothetical protein [Pseudomonas hunanensis]
MLEPKDAIIRYYEAFGDILASWASSSPSVTPAQIEMCNAFSVLRSALDRNETPPEKHNSETAFNLIKTIGLYNNLGI